MIHEALELFGSEQSFEFTVDSDHPLHILRTRQSFLPKAGVLKMHSIERIDTNGVRDAQLPRQTHGLLARLLFGRTLYTVGNGLLRREQTGEQSN